MGVFNRDYMQADGRRSPWTGGRITWWIIGINAVLWVLFSGSYHSAGRGLYYFIEDYLVLHPREVFGSWRLWQPFTAFWLHDPAGASHVFWNMLLLYFFGRTVETWLGGRGYLRLYLGGGLASTLLIVLWSYAVGYQGTALGASGAVFAVMVWYACKNPRQTVLFMFVIPMPIWLLVGVLMVGREFLTLSQSGFQSGSAVGHLAGAAFGWFYYRRGARFPQAATSGPGSWVVDLKKRREASREQEQRERKVDERARVDALLQKIHEHGIGALSEQEKQFLQDASSRYR